MNLESGGTEYDRSPDLEKTKSSSKKVLDLFHLLLQTIHDIPNLVVYKESVNIMTYRLGSQNLSLSPYKYRGHLTKKGPMDCLLSRPVCYLSTKW